MLPVYRLGILKLYGWVKLKRLFTSGLVCSYHQEALADMLWSLTPTCPILQDSTQVEIQEILHTAPPK